MQNAVTAVDVHRSQSPDGDFLILVTDAVMRDQLSAFESQSPDGDFLILVRVHSQCDHRQQLVVTVP